MTGGFDPSPTLFHVWGAADLLLWVASEREVDLPEDSTLAAGLAADALHCLGSRSVPESRAQIAAAVCSAFASAAERVLPCAGPQERTVRDALRHLVDAFLAVADRHDPIEAAGIQDAIASIRDGDRIFACDGARLASSDRPAEESR